MPTYEEGVNQLAREVLSSPHHFDFFGIWSIEKPVSFC